VQTPAVIEDYGGTNARYRGFEANLYIISKDTNEWRNVTEELTRETEIPVTRVEARIVEGVLAIAPQRYVFPLGYAPVRIVLIDGVVTYRLIRRLQCREVSRAADTILDVRDARDVASSIRPFLIPAFHCTPISAPSRHLKRLQPGAPTGVTVTATVSSGMTSSAFQVAM
jgi:hypothetical protein